MEDVKQEIETRHENKDVKGRRQQKRERDKGFLKEIGSKTKKSEET